MLFFIGEAMADGAATQSSGWLSALPMVAFIAVIYFLLIRPQQKRQKQHQSLVASIKKGDKVVTNSGIIATVSKVPNDNEVILEIADGVHCKFVKSAIVSIATNETAASGDSKQAQTGPVLTKKVTKKASNPKKKNTTSAK